MMDVKKNFWLVILTLFLPFSLQANVFFEIASFSDRRDNPYLLEILLYETYADKIAVIEGLGVREDHFVADIIMALSAHPGDKYQSEHLLRLILHAVFLRKLEDAELAARLTANREAIDHLFANLYYFHEPMLRKDLIDLLAFYPLDERESLLMRELLRIVGILEQQAGNDPGIFSELSAIFNMLDKYGSRDFAEPLGMVIKLCRNRELVQQARELAGRWQQ